VVISPTTPLEDPSTGTINQVSGEYNATNDIQGDGLYHIYVRGACSDKNSGWASTLYYKFTGTYCEYNVSGQTQYTTEEGELKITEWGSHVEFWQAGIRIATVSGEAAAKVATGGATVKLIPNLDVTVKWIGGGEYPDACTLLIKKGDDVILSKTETAGLVDDTTVDELYKFTPTCP
jgi:hypothetical protein